MDIEYNVQRSHSLQKVFFLDDDQAVKKFRGEQDCIQ